MTTQQRSSPSLPNTKSHHWIILAVVLTAAFMAILDFNIVNVAIPTIQKTLHASFAQVQLVVATYGLAYAAGLITGGRLGDMYGHKRLFLIGTLCFTITSAFCGFAPSIEILIAARVLQGLSASLMFPQVLSIIQVNFEGKERNTAFALYGAVLGLAFIAAYIFGGLFIAANPFNLEWRPIFLVNLIFGCIAIGTAWFFLQESRRPESVQLDLVGVGIVSVGLVLLVYPLVVGRDAHWPWWIWLCMLVSFVVLVLFVFYERWLSQRQSPLLSLDLFKDHSFRIGLLLALFLFQSSGSFLFILALYLQLGLHDSALSAGLTFLPLGISFLLASLLSSRLSSRLGSRLLTLGSFITIVGLIVVMLLLHRVSSNSLSFNLFLLALFVYGFGIGSVISPLFSTILAGIRNADSGAASGVLVTIQQIAIAIGIAVVGLFFFSVLSNNANNVSNQLAPNIRTYVTDASRTPQQTNATVSGLHQCIVERANEADPYSLPTSCSSTPLKQLETRTNVVATIMAQVDLQNYSDALFNALFYNAILMGVVFLLTFLLPRSAHDNVRKQKLHTPSSCLTVHG